MKRLTVALLIGLLILGSLAGCPGATEFEFGPLTVNPAEVVVGEPFTVTTEITNVGGAEGVYSASLAVDGEVVDTADVTVAAGATEKAALTCTLEASGVYTIELAGLTATVTALRPAELEVKSVAVTPELVLPGQEATFTADVTNVGEATGDFMATLKVNGVETDSCPVTLAGGASDVASFSVIRDVPGNYNLALEGVSTTLNVAEVETYSNETYFYSVSYPSGWELVDESPDQVFVGKTDVAVLGIIVEAHPLGTSVDDFYSVTMDTLKAGVSDFQELSRTEIKENGTVVGYDVECVHTIEGTELWTHLVLNKLGRWGFGSFYQARETAYKMNKPLLDACLDSFELPTVATGSYTNTTHGFSLTLPEGWDGLETDGLMPLLSIEGPVGEPVIYVYTFVERLFEDTTAEDYALNVASEFSGMPGYKISSQGEVTLGTATEGYEVLFTHTEQGYPITRKLVSVVRGTQVFLTLVYTLSSTYNSELDAIDQFVKSFTLEEPQPFGVSRQSSLFYLGGEIVTLDPALTEGEMVIDAVFSGLVKIGEDWEVVPDIAQSWDVSQDGTVYTFHLREGVTFHDGTPVTAYDFKYSWERACDPETESRKASTYLGDIVGAKEMLAGQATELSGVRVIDDLTLEVTIDGPKPYFLGKLAWPTSFVLDRTNVSRGINWTDNPNGTGPFRLKEWKKDELLVLERNDDYYAAPAKLENIVLQLFAGRLMMMYEQGEIDTAGVYLDDLDRVLDPSDPLNQELLTEPAIGIGYLGFNVTMPPFDDPKVRRAFALALDVDKILEVSYKENAQRSGSYLPPRIPGHNQALVPLPFDPEQAQQLIAESKYGSVGNLPPVKFYTLYSLGDAEEAMIGMWQQNLGVTVEAEIIEELEEWYERSHNREFQLFRGGWYADYIDPQNFLEVLFHSQSEENRFTYSNPEVDAALEAAAVEPDEAVRLTMYQDIEKLILEELPVVPLYHSWINHVLVKPYVEGYFMTPTDENYLTLISITPH